MKRYVLLLAVALSVGMQAQRVYKEQIFVSGECFTLQGELLRVQMRVSYNGGVLNSGEMLNFTPVLKNANQRQALSSVVINGKERSRYEKRQAALKKRQRQNVPVVRRDKQLGTYYFDYDTTVPYSDWMLGASLYIESEESGWTGNVHLYEDKLIDQVSLGPCDPPATLETAIAVLASPKAAQTDAVSPATPSPVPATVSQPAPDQTSSSVAKAPRQWIPFLPLSAVLPVSEQTVSGIITLTEDQKDKTFCESVAKELDKRLSSEGVVIASLSIQGFGAPVGNYRRNEQQSASRAQQLKEYLIAHQAAKTVSVTWMAEDWQRIIRLTQADNTLTLRSAALDIMQNVDITSGREDQLRMLASGQTYQQLSQRIFPQVQRIEYMATLQHPMVNTSEPAELQSLYKTASGLSRTSSEFSDLVDLAARLYPDNAVAAINAAGIALTKGQIDKADRYLSPWQTDARAYQNLGVLNLLKGDTARAEVYLRMAEAQGVPEAAEVLAELMK